MIILNGGVMMSSLEKNQSKYLTATEREKAFEEFGKSEWPEKWDTLDPSTKNLLAGEEFVYLHLDQRADYEQWKKANLEATR